MNKDGPGRAFYFYAIAFGLAVLVRLMVPLVGEASLILTMLTPAVAVVIMMAIVAPEGGFRAAIDSLGLTSAGLKGWPFAIGAPVIIHLIGLAILVTAGLTSLVSPQMSASLPATLLKISAGLAIGTLFALCEEVGWRGYMLSRMRGYSLISGMLIVGLLHGIWHMPLLLTTDYYHAGANAYLVVPLFLVTLTLAGVFYGFLRVWTQSIWPVACAHSAANMAWEVSGEISQTKSPIVLEYIGGESGIVVIVGLLVIDGVLIRLLRSRQRGALL